MTLHERGLVSESVLDWYHRHGRNLPWRNTRDSYAIWVSEIMLQQTRVETVIPYYHRFLDRFADISALAKAEADEVLALWSGLGYYSRGKNLHKAARILHRQGMTSLPADEKSLCQLPGIGLYTARAILCFVYNQPVLPLDGNIKRLGVRIACIDEDPKLMSSVEKIERALLPYFPAGKAGDFGQALMDIASQICLPDHPRCDLCPVNRVCKARLSGRQDSIPPKPKRKASPVEKRWVLFHRDPDGILFHKRPARGLLAGMWELPNAQGLDWDEAVAKIEGQFGMRVRECSDFFATKHVFTHRIWDLNCRNCLLENIPANGEFQRIQPGKLKDFPVPAVFSRIVHQMQGIPNE